MEEQRIFGSRCCNPFQYDCHKSSQGIRIISASLQKKFINIPAIAKLCSLCRKEMTSLSFMSPLQIYVNNVNEVDDNNCEPSIFHDKIESEFDCENSRQMLDSSEDEAYLPLSLQNVCNDELHKAAMEVFEQIKEKFKNSTSNAEKILLLTLAPKSWGRRRLAKEFDTSERLVRKAKMLVAESGILTSPKPKKGRTLSPETESLVKNFYVSDENSRMLPGMKDYVSVKLSDGSREQVQKRLILCNLSELHVAFLNQYPKNEVSLSKFSQIKPPNCVLAGSKGTHTVCVCVHHENVNLMIEAVNIKELTCDTDSPMITYHDAIKKIVCSNASPDCFLDECNLCPGTDPLMNFLNAALTNHYIEKIEFQCWQQTDRSTLHTEIADAEDFTEGLCERLYHLKSHSFVAKEQSSFLKNLKTNLKEGEFIVQCDFAENYAFVVQNAAQSFHWNNNQVTIFTTVLYYKDGDKLEHCSLAILSDCLNHDTVAVYGFQKIIMNFLKENFEPKKLFYFTDGAPQQFKNKYNFINLMFHETDFGIPCEWHFHATAHGKGPGDGIGGTLKRLARIASLQASSKDAILTADDLYQWSKENLTEITVFFSSKEDHAACAEELKIRFASSKTVPGTLKYHCFIPTKDSTLILKKYSTSSKYDVFPKTKSVGKETRKRKRTTM